MYCRQPFTSLLQEFAQANESKFTCDENTLKSHESDIIDLFGGFGVLVYLSLSNPQCENFLAEKNFATIKQLTVDDNASTCSSNVNDLKLNHDQEHLSTYIDGKHDKKLENRQLSTDVDDTFHSQTSFNSIIIVNEQQSESNFDSQLIAGVATHNSVNMVRIDDTNNRNKEKKHVIKTRNNDKKENNVGVCNVKEFHTQFLTILVDPYSDFYSHVLNISLDRTRFIVDKILYSKWFPVSWASTVAISYILSQIYWSFYGYNNVYLVVVSIPYLCICLNATLYNLSANIGICWLIVCTFDFWYKTYNLICLIISSYVIKGVYYNALHFAIVQAGFLPVFSMLFVLDAVRMSRLKKNIFTITTVGIMSYNAWYYYFTTPEVYWDPYNSEHTRMNFKSLLMSSFANLVLFILKPMLTEIVRKCRSYIFITHSNHNMVNNNSVQRCYMLYKRPRIKWNITTTSSNFDNGIAS